jgi:ribosomal-protein-alanine N-acetyltransferase
MNARKKDGALVVRPITNDDAEVGSLMEIDHEAYADNMMNVYTAKTFVQYGKGFGLFEKERLKGFVIFIRSWDDPCLAYLKKMAIEKSNRRRGYGKLLLSASLDAIRGEGIARVVLTVAPNNLPALHLYRDLFGFRVIEYRAEEYGEGQDRLFLQLDLDDLDI